MEQFFSNFTSIIKDKRNLIVSVVSGALFSIGWWLAIDAAAAYPSNADLIKASHACGVIGTIALIMVNSVTNSQIRGDSMYSDGCFGKTGARVWIFLAFLMCFGSLISAGWVFFDYYIYNGRAYWPGLAILLQNILIFASTFLFKFGRSEDMWTD